MRAIKLYACAFALLGVVGCTGGDLPFTSSDSSPATSSTGNAGGGAGPGPGYGASIPAATMIVNDVACKSTAAELSVTSAHTWTFWVGADCGDGYVQVVVESTYEMAYPQSLGLAPSAWANVYALGTNGCLANSGEDPNEGDGTGGSGSVVSGPVRAGVLSTVALDLTFLCAPAEMHIQYGSAAR